MPPAARRLTIEDRARLQLRVVRVVYRGQTVTLGELVPPYAREAALAALRQRSLDLLDGLRSTLDGKGGWHDAVLADLVELEREIGGSPAAER